MILPVIVVSFACKRDCKLAIDYTVMLPGALDFIVTYIAV